MSLFTCQRAIQRRIFLRNSSSQDFLAEWAGILDEIRESFDDLRSIKNCSSLPLNVKAACLLLHDFLNISSQFPAVSKQISLEKGAHLLMQMLKLDSYDEHILIALKSFMGHYPAVSYRHRATITKYLSKLFDCDCQKLTLRAAQCFASLPLIGPAGEKRVKYVENWNSFFRFITIIMHDSLHELMNVLDRSKVNCQFGLKSEASKNDFMADIKLPKLDTTNVSQLGNRMNFCCVILSALLDNDLPPVSLPISALIHYFSCFSEALRHHKQLRNEVLKCLLHCLPRFSRFLVKIVRLTKLNIIAYSPDLLFSIESIFHHFAQNEENCNESKIRLYELLCDISSNVGAPLKIHNLIWKLWPKMKLDLQLEAIPCDKIKENGSTKQENKKKRKKVKESEIMEVDYGDQFITKKRDFTAKCRLIQEICKFLNVSSRKLAHQFKPALFRDLQQFVCKLLLEILKNTDNINNAYHFDRKCTLSLLDLLLQIILSKNSGCPPAVLCAAEIFNEFSRNSNDCEIVDLCSKAFPVIDSITKPRVPSLENRIEADFDNVKVAAELDREDDEKIMSKLNEILKPSAETDQQKIHLNGDSALPMKQCDEEPKTNYEDDYSQEPIVVTIDDEEDRSILETSQPPPVALTATKVHAGRESYDVDDEPNAKKSKLNDSISNQKSSDELQEDTENKRNCSVGGRKSFETLSCIDDLIADFVDAPVEDENY